MINTRKPSCVVGSWPASRLPASWPAGRRAAPTPDARAADAEAEADDPAVSRPAPAELPKLRLTAAAWPAASMGAWPPPRRERRSHQVGRRLDLAIRVQLHSARGRSCGAAEAKPTRVSRSLRFLLAFPTNTA